MDDLEKSILAFLQSRPPDWKWGTATQMFSRDETIERFKKDKKFRKFIIERAHILAVELFLKASNEGSMKK
jgi:hypothetical protein